MTTAHRGGFLLPRPAASGLFVRLRKFKHVPNVSTFTKYLLEHLTYDVSALTVHPCQTKRHQATKQDRPSPAEPGGGAKKGANVTQR